MENQKIIDYLRKQGIRPQNLGFRYAYEAIEYCLNKGYVPAITKEVYPYIAKKLNTRPSRVERAIRHEVEDLCTNKEFIATAIIELSIKNSK